MQAEPRDCLQAFALSRSEIVPGLSREPQFSCIGAVNDITLGVFNTEKFCYESKHFLDDYEISSCVGTVTRMDKEPWMHIHMTIVNPIQATCFAGHLNAAVVSLTGEFVIQKIDSRVGRKYSPEIGLNLFEFEE